MVIMITQQRSLQQESILKAENGYQFIDSYKGRFPDPEDAIGIQQVTKLFFSAGPKWLDRLFAFRNRMVKFFGLKVPGKVAERKRQLQNFSCAPGEQIGLFKVIQRTENEVVLGEDDKHLDFRVSLLLQKSCLDDKEKELTITTLVKFHNRMGRLYFIPVKPFHRLIVPAMLKGIIRKLKAEEASSLL